MKYEGSNFKNPPNDLAYNAVAKGKLPAPPFFFETRVEICALLNKHGILACIPGDISFKTAKEKRRHLKIDDTEVFISILFVQIISSASNNKHYLLLRLPKRLYDIR